jgi:hypothetical protein
VYGRNVNRKGNIYNLRIRRGSSVWHVVALRVASLLDRSAQAREVLRERRGREEKTSYYRVNFGWGCVLGDVVVM